MKVTSYRKAVCMNVYSIQCLACPGSFPLDTTVCPNCGTRYDHLYSPTHPKALAKREKHREIVNSGTLTAGDGPLGLNASFDTYGDSIYPHLVRYALLYGHRCLIRNGPNREQSTGLLVYVPEPIGSGISKQTPELFAVSGLAIMSPLSVIWGHVFPASKTWMDYQKPIQTQKCANKSCTAAVAFGTPFCNMCLTKIGNSWRPLIS